MPRAGQPQPGRCRLFPSEQLLDVAMPQLHQGYHANDICEKRATMALVRAPCPIWVVSGLTGFGWRNIDSGLQHKPLSSCAMPKHYNPTRRNRNIGTSKQGHGANNRMAIPQLSAAYRECTAKIGSHVKIDRTVNGRDVTFIVEQTSGGCSHACTVDDVQFMLSYVPAADWVGLKTFVLRQPSRKSRMLNPVWGRLFYHADLAFSGSNNVKSGPALFLEACQIDRPIKWSTSLDRETGDELDRLRADGHRIDRIGKQYVISTDLASVRATQLDGSKNP